MPENDDTIPGEVQMTIGGAQSEAQRKKNEKQVYDEAQKDVIDPLNKETEKPADPDYIKGGV